MAAMNFVEDCLDEIALEGLDGITLSALWIRLESRKPDFTLPLDNGTKEYLWSSVIREHSSLEFYELPKPRPVLVLYDRFKCADPETGVIIQTGDRPADIYPVRVIKNHPNGIMGSCESFDTRTNVTQTVRQKKMDLNSVKQSWGEKLVVVASQRLRTRALFGNREIDPDVVAAITDVKYGILERIGRSRYHGEVTQTDDGLKVFSLQPKSVFYVRKILRNSGLITVQPICIRSTSGVSVSGKLMHLTRFYMEFRPMYMFWLEDLTVRLADKPQQREVFVKIRSEMGLKEKVFKKLCNVGRNHIKTEILSHRELYPDADEKEYMKKSNNGERCARVIRLIKPFTVKQLLDEEDEEELHGKDEDDDAIPEDLDLTALHGKDSSKDSVLVSLSCDRPVLHQAFTLIESAGSRGFSTVEVAKRFGITKLDSRTITRNLVRNSSVVVAMQDEGKNRVSRFIATHINTKLATTAVPRPVIEVEPEGNRTLPQDTDVSMLEDSVCMENSANQSNFTNQSISLNQTVDLDSELTSNEVQEKEKLRRKLGIFPEATTLRALRRANTILMAVTKAKIITDKVLIQKKIRAEEAAMSATSTMDRKSFLRLIDALCDGNKIKQIVSTVQLHNGQSKELIFLCDPSVSDDDPLVKNALDAASQKLLMVKSDSSTNQKMECKEENPSELEKFDMEPVYDMAAPRSYGFLPRMARLKTLHQLLWCLVYGQPEAADGTAAAGTDANESTEDSRQLMQLGDFYLTPKKAQDSDALLNSHLSLLNWHKQLPRLPVHAGYKTGWCCFLDIVQAIPIFILCQLVSVTYKIDGLKEFLDDPATRFTPFGRLPISWQKTISQKRRHVRYLFDDSKLLAQLGLVTFGKRDFKQKEQGFIYVHKLASLIDTTNSSIPREQFLVHEYHFETFKNLEDYWLSMQSISFNTPQENLSATMQPRYCNADKRFEECLAEKEVETIADCGLIPGDGMGAAGTDSTFFTHLRRNWSRSSGVTTEALIIKGQYLANERAETRVLRGKKRKTKQQPKLDKPASAKGKKAAQAKTDSNVKYTKATVSGVTLKKGGKGIKRKRTKVIEGLLKKSKRIREKRKVDSESASGGRQKGKRSRNLDPKDIEAVRLLKRYRSTWTPQEDSLLLLCQLTNQFLTGNIKLSLVGHAVIRNILHENLEVSRDKTRLACSRRMKYMMKNHATVHNVQMYLGEALQDKELVAEFKEGKKYVATNATENEPVFKRCLAKMREKFRCENKFAPEIPDTVKEFYRRYSVIESLDSGKTVHCDVKSLSEIFCSVLHNVIHSAIVLTDTVGRSHELFQLFRMYPEPVLDAVFTSMKNDKILTKIKKCLAKKSKVGGIPLTTIGTYQISQRYMYFWLSAYPRGLFEEGGRAILNLPPDPDDPAHGSDFLRLLNLTSHSIMTITLMSSQLITFQTTLPEQIVVIDKMTEEKDWRQPKKRQKLDNDSDPEEDALIEEAERVRQQSAPQDGNRMQQDNNAESDVNETPSVLMYNRNSSSRTVLSYRRCQYVHSKTVHLINSNDNLFVNACDIRIRLKPCELRTASSAVDDRNVWINNLETHKSISKWNKTHVMIHPKTCQIILKTVRTTYPDRIKSDVGLESCLWRFNEAEAEIVYAISMEIKQREFLGMTVYELMRTFSNIGSHELKDLLTTMVDCKLIVRVGVIVFRYVWLEFASGWLIRIDKIPKGRGNQRPDEDEDVDVQDYDDRTSSVKRSFSFSASDPPAEVGDLPGDKKKRNLPKDSSSLLFQTPAEKESDKNIKFQKPANIDSDENVGPTATEDTSKKRQRSEMETEDGDAAVEVLAEPPAKCLKLSDAAAAQTQCSADVEGVSPTIDAFLQGPNDARIQHSTEVGVASHTSCSKLDEEIQHPTDVGGMLLSRHSQLQEDVQIQRSIDTGVVSACHSKLDAQIGHPTNFDVTSPSVASCVNDDNMVDSSEFKREAGENLGICPAVLPAISGDILEERANDVDKVAELPATDVLVSENLDKLQSVLDGVNSRPAVVEPVEDGRYSLPTVTKSAEVVVDCSPTSDETVIVDCLATIADSSEVTEGCLSTSGEAVQDSRYDLHTIDSPIPGNRYRITESLGSSSCYPPTFSETPVDERLYQPSINENLPTNMNKHPTTVEDTQLSKRSVYFEQPSQAGFAGDANSVDADSLISQSAVGVASSEDCISSILNSAPKTLRRPRDFLKSRASARRSEIKPYGARKWTAVCAPTESHDVQESADDERVRELQSVSGRNQFPLLRAFGSGCGSDAPDFNSNVRISSDEQVVDPTGRRGVIAQQPPVVSVPTQLSTLQSFAPDSNLNVHQASDNQLVNPFSGTGLLAQQPAVLTMPSQSSMLQSLGTEGRSDVSDLNSNTPLSSDDRLANPLSGADVQVHQASAASTPTQSLGTECNSDVHNFNSDVNPFQENPCIKAAAPTSKEQETPDLLSPNKKTPVVRLGTSGTCTYITVLTDEEKSSSLKSCEPTAEIQSTPMQVDERFAEIPDFADTVSNIASVGTPLAPEKLGDTSSIAAPSAGLTQIPITVSSQLPAFCPGPGPRLTAPQIDTTVASSLAGLPREVASPSGSQRIGIRVRASSVGNLSREQIEALLIRQGAIKPGQPFTVRLPPGLAMSKAATSGTNPPTGNPSVTRAVAPAIAQPVVPPTTPSGTPSDTPSVAAHVSSSGSGGSLPGVTPIVQDAVTNSVDLVREVNTIDTICRTPVCGAPHGSFADNRTRTDSPTESSKLDRDFRLPQLDGAADENSMDGSSNTLLTSGNRTGMSTVHTKHSQGGQSVSQSNAAVKPGKSESGESTLLGDLTADADESEVGDSVGQGDEMEGVESTLEGDSVVNTGESESSESASQNDLACSADQEQELVKGPQENEGFCQMSQAEEDDSLSTLNSGMNLRSRSARQNSSCKKIRLVPRPWRTPEGTINRLTLQTMLEAVMLFIIENPGITRDLLVKKYSPVLQPVAVFELLEILDEVGCVERTFLRRTHKPSLFSSRARFNVVPDDVGSETEILLSASGCMLKLGQFFVQLTGSSNTEPVVS